MILEVKNGSFSYGRREVLKNVSFDLEERKIMTVLGPNGVGKTTLLKCIMGFLRWDSGETVIAKRNLKEYSDKELWREISYVPQAKQGVFSYGVLEMVVMGLDKENSFFYTPKKDRSGVWRVIMTLPVFQSSGCRISPVLRLRFFRSLRQRRSMSTSFCNRLDATVQRTSALQSAVHISSLRWN